MAKLTDRILVMNETREEGVEPRTPQTPRPLNKRTFSKKKCPWQGQIAAKIPRITRLMAYTLVIGLCVSGAGVAHAAIVDSLYTETAGDFTWRFTWDGMAGPVGFSIDTVDATVPASVFWKAPATVPIPDPTAPGGVREQAVGGAAGPIGGFVNLGVLLGGGGVVAGNDLFLAIQHAQGPHVGLDVDPGDRLVARVPNADFAALAGPGFTPIGGPLFLAHQPHLDKYTLDYRSIVGGGVEFQVKGVHVVPLPSAFLLLGSGLAVLVWRGKRVKLGR